MEGIMAQTTLNLTDLIVAVRSELENADLTLRAARKPALFRLTGMELQLNFTVTSADSVKGGFDLKIVALGSKLDHASEEVQKIKIKFDVPRGTADEVAGGRFDQEPSLPRTRDRSVRPLKPRR
jgi:hypothetical protein